ncbi:MAG: amidase [Fluviicoccus sp.]|uniref:amidase n=1 Tax=Fluviicoccus sp. TaxID=2003552 RepID=UPI0027219688|nr:amidase [Fluviicoccus sp.]MDO8329311.1 amidase [Fluviicoccus sp.]
MTTAKTLHAFTNDALADHDATAIAELIRRGELSAREVAEAAINRAHRMQPQINAIELPMFEAALREAESVRTGVFAGVPTFIKDNTDLKGLPTNQGSAAVNARPAKEDGAFAKQLLAQGFVTLGKSRMPEFGFNASTEYLGMDPVRNPWNTEYSSGASSGGAAALVAAGVAPIAHANDGGGSIRIPAAACGLVGLKPTRGRFIDAESASALPVNIVGEGVVTRSVRDTALFFSGMEQVYKNRRLPGVGLVEGPGKRRLRVGLVLDSINGTATDAETRAAVLQTARVLEGLGHRVQEMPLSVNSNFADDFSIYWGMLSFLVSTFGKQLMSPDFDRSQLDNLSRGLAKHYMKNSLKTPMVLYRLKKSQDDYARMFRDYDVVLSPVLSHTTPKLGWLSPEQDFESLFQRLLQYVCFTPLNNAAGSPAISLPTGSTREGLPIAVHFSGAHGDEKTLLELAFELEQAQGGWRRIQA